ncbi:MAG: lipid-A-disaccharide synthase [Flavobacteriales bacterium]|nr:lipid-A-disaccharide synthase [Flavobacteriales bacterium]
MHYYIISGEPSGDLYGSKLMEHLKKYNPDSQFTCWGGIHMDSAGGQIVVDLESLSYMGFWEVFKNSGFILKNLSYAKSHIKKTNPDVLILIDYPGFNLRIAKYAKKIDIPVYWFIAPQLWAWKGNRIRVMRKYIDKLFVALPFELDYFKDRGLKTFYFGHPLLDIAQSKKKLDSSLKLGKPLIALLPGSRKQEIRKILPIMLGVLPHFLDYRFVIICVNNIQRSFYENLIGDLNVELKFNKDILYSVSGAVVTSGTATLELAIYKIPQVVCYKLDFISFILATLFARVKYISLVNILSNKRVVKELIQSECHTSSIVSELRLVLEENNVARIVSEYEKLIDSIGPVGCFQQIAKIIYSDLLVIKKHAKI